MSEQQQGALAGASFLITAGPTRAYIDSVRFIANQSTGRLGTEIARECLRRGASVTFVHGVGSLHPNPADYPPGQLQLHEIETVSDLLDVLREELRGGNKQVCVHSMAVLDYLPERLNGNKIPSDKEKLTIKMVRAPKIIEQIKNIAPATLLVGFKLEVNMGDTDLIGRARDLMNRTAAEIVVANDLAKIEGDRHPAVICWQTPDGLTSQKVEGKPVIARVLADLISRRLESSAAEVAAHPPHQEPG